MTDENGLMDIEGETDELRNEFDTMMQMVKEKTTRWDIIYERAGIAGEQVAGVDSLPVMDGMPSQHYPEIGLQQRYLWSLLQVTAKLGRDLARIDDRLSRLERKVRSVTSHRV